MLHRPDEVAKRSPGMARFIPWIILDNLRYQHSTKDYLEYQPRIPNIINQGHKRSQTRDDEVEEAREGEGGTGTTPLLRLARTSRV